MEFELDSETQPFLLDPVNRKEIADLSMFSIRNEKHRKTFLTIIKVTFLLLAFAFLLFLAYKIYGPQIPYALPTHHLSNHEMRKLRIETMSQILNSLVSMVFAKDDWNEPNPCVETEGVPLFTPSKFDCRKYYGCDRQYGAASKVIEYQCQKGFGFDPASKKCRKEGEVNLCRRMDGILLRDHNCTSKGLFPYYGDCSNFIICSRMGGIAFLGWCLTGDFFHPELKLCLPHEEINC